MHFLGRLISITISYSLFIALVERACNVFIRLCISKVPQKPKGIDTITQPVAGVESLYAFDYRAEEPIKYRPFEKKQHVAMGMLHLVLCLRFL